MTRVHWFALIALIYAQEAYTRALIRVSNTELLWAITGVVVYLACMALAGVWKGGRDA